MSKMLNVKKLTEILEKEYVFSYIYVLQYRKTPIAPSHEAKRHLIRCNGHPDHPRYGRILSRDLFEHALQLDCHLA
jgi:hypothetical protein